MVTTRFDIETIVYLYLFICISLLIFNLLYIFGSKGRKKRQEKMRKSWEKQIQKQRKRMKAGQNVGPEHKKLMSKRLRRINSLMAYGQALNQLTKEDPQWITPYLQANQGTFQILASYYGKKDSMDRAYFAYFISKHKPYDGQEFRPLMEILISYLDNSTVYCKENVLKALYSLGNCQAVESALQVFHDRGWFHHQKLLSDGLLSFSGNKEELAVRLWGHLKNWDTFLMLSIIQFITGFSENFKEIFLPVLEREDVDLEIRLAILRYYRRHIYEPVRPLLQSYLLEESKEDNLKIVSAFVLSKYPGSDSVQALKQAVYHTNWFVRYNAADSLIELGVSEQELKDVFAGEDRYAKEMLGYMLENAKAGV